MPANNDTATFPTVGATAVTVTLADAAGTAVQSVTLHDINFDSTTTSYTIEQFGGMGTITLDGSAMSSFPKINVISGNHTINAPIALAKDSRFTLHAGSLTLGPSSTITSAGAWNLSEGSGSGVLNNQGTITPTSLLIEGNTVNNSGTISPTGALTISGLGAAQA
jgi:hypothetical protein